MTDSTETIRFIRLKNGDDLVAYTIELPTSLVIRRPIGVAIESLFEVNKQIITMYEWCTPSIADYETLTLDMNDVMFCLPVQAEFETRYIEMSDVLFDPINYENRTERKAKKKKVQKEEGNNVVSIVDALAGMIEKKDKPIH